MTKARNHELSHMIVRIHAGILALVCAVICGVALFIMTAWLLIKGGPNVGAHLRLLSQFLVGYSVTWGGSIVGLCYGMLIGAILGWTIAVIYNTVVRLRRG